MVVVIRLLRQYFRAERTCHAGAGDYFTRGLDYFRSVRFPRGILGNGNDRQGIVLYISHGFPDNSNRGGSPGMGIILKGNTRRTSMTFMLCSMTERGDAQSLPKCRSQILDFLTLPG